MYTKLPGKFLSFLFKGLPLLIAIGGSILLIISHFFFVGVSMPVKTEIFSEMLKVPLGFFDLEVHQYVLETRNYLLFQNFSSLPPVVFPTLTLVFGAVIWLLIGIGVSLVSLFDRMQFIISMGVVIFLLTLTGVNGLNIGGINTNLAMMILLIGVVLPAVLIHTFCFDWSLAKRVAVILPIALLTLPLLLILGDVTEGRLLISENLSILCLAVSTMFMLYVGHTVISSVFVLLVKLNKGVRLKISWHLSLITLIYLLFFLFLLLKATGNISFKISSPPVLIVLLIVGILGFFETKLKIGQIKQPYAFTAIGEGLYLVGFAITVLVFWKADFSANRPMMDFLEHIFIYTQLAFGLLFYAYLMANFTGIMNQGGQVEAVVFKPKFFAYYHMRIGALLAMLSMVVFADGIIGVQLNAASTNVTADYYYETDRPREASILYENSWERYRRNEKAINAVAHLALSNKQPTAAMNTLLRSFENRPSVNDLLLLSSLLQQEDKVAEALVVLERGLIYFPESTYLLNNIALNYSRMNRVEEAFGLLDHLNSDLDVVAANKVGIQAKHLIHYDEKIDVKNNTIGQVNQLAFSNLKVDSSNYSIPLDEVKNAGLPSRAILRNQWSHHVTGDIKAANSLVDTLLLSNYDPSIQEELRESRVIRSFQQDYTNESLKHLNGLAYQFPANADYFHSMAANILIGQLDFEKAAIELKQAAEKGWDDFKPEYMPILYFGGLKEKAFEIRNTHQVPFPEWLAFSEEGSLLSNDTTVYFSSLASLNVMIKDQFLAALNEIQSENLKRQFAYQILLRKSHWLGQDEIERLIGLVEEDRNANQKYLHFEDLKALLIHQDTSVESGFLAQNLAVDRNAYWTPLVFIAMEQAENDLAKYDILVEASNFNKDPLLWINLVKYSRIVGVDHYASSTLSKMSEWIDLKTLEKLQLQNL